MRHASPPPAPNQVKAQEHMQRIMPPDGPEHAALQTTLYRAHVYMITHGAVRPRNLPRSPPPCSRRTPSDPA